MIRLEDCWYSQNPVAWVLLPVSWLFCAIAMLRRLCYRAGLVKSFKMPVPVIIVGNISVGGTGKTPLLIALCQLLKQQGLKAGIVSRGYGGDFSGQKLVADNDTASSVGDEPYLLKQRTGLPVAIGADRPATVQLLLQQHDCDLVLSDDGLQHYRLKRDFEIAVVDSNRLFGNGFCLPAGPLRETPGRLSEVDIVAYHVTGNTNANKDSSFVLEFGSAVNLLTGETRTIDSFRDDLVHAVAGIGHPARFFTQLRTAGLSLTEHAFPDHYTYSLPDITFDDGKPVLMTEKDAVKCIAFAHAEAWYLPVTARLSAQLVSNFTAKVSQLVNGKVDA